MTQTEIAQKMAEKVKEKDLLEAKKKIVTSDYNDKIKGVEAQISELAEQYLNPDDQMDAFDEETEEAEYQDVTGPKQLNSGLELPENALVEDES